MVVFLMLIGTVLWGGRLFGHEFAAGSSAADAPAATVTVPTIAQLKAMNAAGLLLTPRDSASWNALTPAGEPAGVILSSEPFALEITGFGGPTPLYIYVDAGEKVRGVAVADNDETPSFLKAASEPLFVHWRGLPAEDVVAQRVDAVTGATYTSKSLIHNVKLTLNAYLKQTAAATDNAPAVGWVKAGAVVAVLLTGAIVAWRFRQTRWLRLMVLALNVGVTGFWAGQFLSLALLRQWVADGLSPLFYLPALVMLCMALIMPFLGRRRYFCTWVCPYGSLQQLAWQIPVPKLHLGDKALRLMRRCRTGVLLALLFSLWAGYGLFLLDYEPFSAFLVTVAPPVVVVLAAFFVVLGLFVPTPWCRALCPLGELLELAETGGRKKSGRSSAGRHDAVESAAHTVK